MAKARLDELLLKKGLFDDLDAARRAVWAGEVIVDDHLADQPAARFAGDADIRLRRRQNHFVSRGGEKLDAALSRLKVSAEDRIALDIGASTGGFTDCLLSRGAKRVYAVDIGRGQLAQKLRLNPAVVDLGGTDAMTLTVEDFHPSPDLAVADVTFRSLAEVLPHVHSLLSGKREMVALLKPLFEARLAGMGRVREVQRRVFEHLLPRLEEGGIPIHDLIVSETPGSGGAVEFFLHIGEPVLLRAQVQERLEKLLGEAKRALVKGQRSRRGGSRSRKA